MSMAELKTKPTKVSVEKFIKRVPDAQTREDCFTILKLMSEATGEPPKMWGNGIVGFGLRRYKGASGREVDWLIIGFSPRKQNISLYLMVYGLDSQDELLKKLGKHSLGKGCLYIKRLSDVDLPLLKKVIKAAVKKQDAQVKALETTRKSGRAGQLAVRRSLTQTRKRGTSRNVKEDAQ
jgi:hypothetical protein